MEMRMAKYETPGSGSPKSRYFENRMDTTTSVWQMVFNIFGGETTPVDFSKQSKGLQRETCDESLGLLTWPQTKVYWMGPKQRKRVNTFPPGMSNGILPARAPGESPMLPPWPVKKEKKKMEDDGEDSVNSEDASFGCSSDMSAVSIPAPMMAPGNCHAPSTPAKESPVAGECKDEKCLLKKRKAETELYKATTNKANDDEEEDFSLVPWRNRPPSSYVFRFNTLPRYKSDYECPRPLLKNYRDYALKASKEDTTEPILKSGSENLLWSFKAFKAFNA